MTKAIGTAAIEQFLHHKCSFFFFCTKGGEHFGRNMKLGLRSSNATQLFNKCALDTGNLLIYRTVPTNTVIFLRGLSLCGKLKQKQISKGY